jgi:hypothetical protein
MPMVYIYKAPKSVVNKIKDFFMINRHFEFTEPSIMDEPVLVFNTDKVFISYESDNYIGEHIGQHILIKQDYNTYVFVGGEIFSFKSLHPIIYFVAEHSGNTIYPYAVDDHYNIYTFLYETKYIIRVSSPTIYKLLSNIGGVYKFIYNENNLKYKYVEPLQVEMYEYQNRT